VEVLPVLRVLWHRRRLLAAGAVITAALVVVFGRPQPSSSAVASTRITLDTPSSQLVAAAPGGADTLPWRALLLSHLMATESSRRQLAQRLGVGNDKVTVFDTALSRPDVPATMPQRAADAAAVTGAPYVLTVSLPSDALPLISIHATAPDRPGAIRLAEAAVAVLEAQSSRGGTYKSPILTDAAYSPRLQSFVVSQVEPVHVKRIAASTPPIKRLAAIFFLFVAWCASVLFLRRLGRARKIAPA
jgi:hypothetical protein